MKTQPQGEEDLLAPLPVRLPLGQIQAGVTFLICAALLWFKIELNAVTFYFGLDGTFYYDLARHVRDGHGLVTQLSLYHKGFNSFPHPDSIYPLWPLLLGYVGRVVPLEWACIWLPTLLYGGTLLVGHRLVMRLWPGPLVPSIWAPITAGHVFLLTFGLNERFFRHTSLPYTEGLAFFLLGLVLLRARRLFTERRLLGAVEVGALLALAMLTRSQAFFAALAVGAALGWALVLQPGRSQTLRLALAVGLSFCATLLPHWIHLATFVPDPRLAYLLRFELYRPTEALSPVQMLVQTDSWWSWLVDRAPSLVLAFQRGGRYTYVNNYGGLELALPAGLGVAALMAWRERARAPVRRAWEWACAQENLYVLFLTLVALGGMLSLHTIHKPVLMEWNFASRHGLTAYFLFLAAALYLARAPTLARLTALILITMSVNSTARQIRITVRDTTRSHPSQQQAQREGSAQGAQDSEGEGRDYYPRELIAWIRERQRRDPDLRLVMPEPQRMARYTTEVGYHWIYFTTPLADLNVLHQQLGADFLLLPTGSVRYANHTDPRAFYTHFLEVESDLSGYDVFVHR